MCGRLQQPCVGRGWTITDAEAAAESAVWYGVPPEDEDAPEQEQAAAEQDVEAALSAPKGKSVGGRWQPADTKRPPHAVDGLQWKASTGVGYKPIIHQRKFPVGSDAKDGFQAPPHPCHTRCRSTARPELGRQKRSHSCRRVPANHAHAQAVASD